MLRGLRARFAPASTREGFMFAMRRAMPFPLLLACILAATGASAQGPANAVIHDIVILKDSQSINGEVKVPVFTLKSKFGTLQISRDNILEIEYRKPPNRLEDEVQLSA